MTRWTRQQRSAIETDGCDILVTASAGTGKTSVLAGRVMRLLSDPRAGIGVRQMLVLTFTNAAAEEMRKRIADELRAQCRSAHNSHLRRQLMLIDAADIGTIHSFCGRLIREHFYLLGIDPAARLIDEDEQKLLRSRILEQTIEWAWQQSNLAGPLGELLGGRNIAAGGYNFLDNILYISNFLDGLVDRDDWLARAVATNELGNPAAAVLADRQRSFIASRLETCRRQLLFAISLDRRLTGGHWADQITDSRLSYIDRAVACIQKADMKGLLDAIDGFAADKKGQRLSNRPKGMSDADRNLIHDPIGKAMDAFTGLRTLAAANPAYQQLAGSAVARQSRVLIELVKRFDFLYREAKKKANCLDFADLEHLATRLLATDKGPSQVARKLQSRYKAIFVDEYQDINTVQKQLLTLLSAGRNVFAVGDVKQSIYAFRGAVPDIFLNDLRRAEEDPAQARRVDLTGNFRSRREVLDFVNAIFDRTMTSDIGGIDYDERARLTGELDYEPLEGRSKAVELHLLGSADAGTDETAEEPAAAGTGSSPRDRMTADQLQAAATARRILQMVGTGGKPEFNVYDKDARSYRPVEFRDIVILMRSLAGANDYAEVLSLAGIPVHSQSAVGYFEATEITDSLALLKVLDNPHRDIEIAAVLRSPMFSLTDTDLLRIRLFGDKASPDDKPGFYKCVLSYAAGGTDAALRNRLAEVLATLQEWRRLVLTSGITDMLWQAYRATGYLSFVAGLPKGRQRRANLLDLHSRAVQFAGFATTPGASLGAFVEFIEKLMEEGGDYKPADILAPGENAVRIMSVHKSKGLEYPVVFLAHLDRRFNLQDTSGECLYDAENTLGLAVVDPARSVRIPSMAGQVIAQRKLAAGLAEEMRVLYVAATRARERLILTASRTLDSCRKTLRNGAAVETAALPEWMLSSCRSHLDWVLYGLSRHTDVHRAIASEAKADNLLPDALLDVHILTHADQDTLADWLAGHKKAHPASHPADVTPSPADDALAIQVAASLKWQYPWQIPSQTLAKTSVTELTHHGDEFRRIDCSAAFDRMPLAMTDAPGTPALSRTLGTATHLVLQSLDIAKPVTKAAVDKTIEHLVARGALAADVAGAVDAEAVMGFFSTDLGRLVQANAAAAMREWPFTFAIPLSEYAPDARGDAAGDKVIVQGIIDLLLPLQGRLLIVDFKTDRIPASHAPARAAMYADQLALYARAAKAILAARRTEQWIYFLHCGQLVKVG